ncbi:hypothetical protein LT493_04250 [Streptomyces tricolor]|nr:hypothetical protein [Streptomyces tricolor]
MSVPLSARIRSTAAGFAAAAAFASALAAAPDGHAAPAHAGRPAVTTLKFVRNSGDPLNSRLTVLRDNHPCGVLPRRVRPRRPPPPGAGRVRHGPGLAARRHLHRRRPPHPLRRCRHQGLCHPAERQDLRRRPDQAHGPVHPQRDDPFRRAGAHGEPALGRAVRLRVPGLHQARPRRHQAAVHRPRRRPGPRRLTVV